ncbi:hypothetical protein OIDMADRAFT_33665 [Oidiodendron maius Zn]|uniref:Zn(2)-C6 fungal-type domain-containing protein n=1 Tax=Oidiodendron maius (strain Zn) TaxID=913774 RepID=A0A0C3GHF6_OIDMZ|nr:hypothetical protein OIDMADRAFT_33665 [Oidiodendron maius Zn]
MTECSRRIRRIKCDEEQPNCGQCTRGRRICDGYVNSSPAGHELKYFSTLLTTSGVHTLLGTDQERRCFDYFCRRTVAQLSGSFDSAFWDQLLLQATHHEPAVWHAVVALGSLHQNFEQRHISMKREDDVFAVKQYVKAIGFVLMPVRDRGKQAADVALMTCILFICFEILRGYHSAALSHIDGGVKIVSELLSCQSNTSLSIPAIPYIPLTLLKQMFSRLDAQASQISNGRPRHLLCANLSTTSSTYDAKIPISFQSFEAASDGLDCIRTCATQAIQSLPPPSSIADPPLPTHAETKLSLDLIRNSSAIRLTQWSSAFDGLLDDRKNFVSEADRRKIQFLKLHHILTGVNYNIGFVRARSDEMMWDSYIQEFRAMLGYAKELLNLTKIRRQPVFMLDTEVILPLFFVAVKCRDGEVRRQAISLLRSQWRQEGVWNSFLAAKVAERVVQIEEGGINGIEVIAADVLRRKRVLGVEVKLDLEQRRANLSYVKLKENGGIEYINEWVRWTSFGFDASITGENV